MTLTWENIPVKVILFVHYRQLWAPGGLFSRSIVILDAVGVPFRRHGRLPGAAPGGSLAARGGRTAPAWRPPGWPGRLSGRDAATAVGAARIT